MEDTISRQAVLDKFEPWLKVKDYNDGELNMLKAILYEIRFMPPATDKNVGTKLSTNLAEVGTDSISRQAAIDDIWTVSPLACLDRKWVDRWLRQLPPAQPEIIRCKDCNHFEYDHPYIIQGIPVLGHEVCNAWGDGCKTDENGYCFMAERRTDEQTD